MEDKILKLVISNKILTVKILLGVIFFGILTFDLFYFGGDYMDRTIFLGIFCLIFLVFIFKLKSKITFILALFLLILVFYNILFNGGSPIIGRLTEWIYLILIVGIVQNFFELKKR